MKNIIGIVFSILVFVSVMYLAHFLFYDYLVRFWNLNSRYRFGVAMVLVFLPLLFIASLVLMHFSGHPIVRGLYYVTGLWHGALVNFLVVIILSWFLVGIFRLFGAELNGKQILIIATIGVTIALGMSLYAIYNARIVVSKKLDLHDMKVPDEWKGRRGVQLSDIHLGSILRSGHMNKIIKQVDDIAPDIIFITGDLLDSIIGNVQYYEDSLKNLKAPLGVYMVSGNHEIYLNSNLVKEVIKLSGINFLDDELVDVEGLQVVGVSYPERYLKKNVGEIIQSLSGYDKNKPSILLYHEPIQLDAIADSGINLVLSGHTHRGQLWPFNYITEMIFGDYHHGLHHKGDMYLYTSSGAGVWGPNMRSSGKNEVVWFEF